MAATVTLRLAPFECEALEGYERSQQVAAARVIRTAVMYYLREREANRAAWAVPQLGLDEPDGATALEVEIGDETRRALEAEAAAQGVDPETLARHALLFFFADVDSGRIATKLGEIVRPD